MTHDAPPAGTPGGDHLAGHDHDHPQGVRGAIKGVFAPHSHDASDSIDGALESSAAGIRAVKVSLLALGATSIVQLSSSRSPGRSPCWPTPFTTSPTP